MPDIVKIRQGNVHTRIWKNHSLLRKSLTNSYNQTKHVIAGGLLSTADIMQSGIDNYEYEAWDNSLDVSTAPYWETKSYRAEKDWIQHSKKKNVRFKYRRLTHVQSSRNRVFWSLENTNDKFHRHQGNKEEKAKRHAPGTAITTVGHLWSQTEQL